MCLRSKRKIEYKPIRKKSKVSKLEESNGMVNAFFFFFVDVFYSCVDECFLNRRILK